MRFAVLGSGSQGTGTLVSSEDTHVLVDCGFSLRETERRLARLGLSAAQLSAVLVTHEHADHVHGVGLLSRRYNLPVYLSRGTLRGMRKPIEPAGFLAGVEQLLGHGAAHAAGGAGEEGEMCCAHCVLS